MTQRKSLTDQEKIEIVEKYNLGFKIKELCNLYNRTKWAITTLLHRRNIKIRPAKEERRVNHFNQDFFEKIDSEEKAYLLGLIFADGSMSIVRKKEKRVSIFLAEEDCDIILKLKNNLNCNFNPILINRKKPRQNLIGYIFYSSKLFDDLMKLGCTPKKSLTLQFPTDNQVPQEFIRHFIRGYFDGDGCICWTGNKTMLVTLMSSKNFSLNLSEVLNKYLKTTGTISKGNPNSEAEIYRLYIGGSQQCVNLLNWLYKDANIFLNRKIEKYLYSLNEYLKKPYPRNTPLINESIIEITNIQNTNAKLHI